ncbi:MAG: MBL fold metallo-hydrolase [candidate division WOR-3 bacterium]
MYKFKNFVHPLFGSNTYLIYKENSDDCVIIDPTDVVIRDLTRFLETENLNPKCIINTHGHYDHISGIDILRNIYKIPLYIHELEEILLKNPQYNLSIYVGKSLIIKDVQYYVKENDEILGFKIIHTPGHTPGSICLKLENMLIVGDLIFVDSIGRVDLPLSSEKDMKISLKKILSYVNENTIILPGHGRIFKLEDLKRKNEILWNFISC